MAAFVAAAVVLVLCVAAVLLRPLWRGARGTALGIGGFVVASAVALYVVVGTPAALDPQNRAMPETLDDAIAQLRGRLERDPAQVDGWRLLGQALGTQQRFAESRDAYAKAAALAPKDADVLVEAAQSRAMADTERRFDDEAVALLRRALELQPKHQRGRWFLGIALRQSGKDADAATLWESLLPEVEPQVASTLRPQIDAARAAAGLPPLPAEAPPPAQGALVVKVSLDPALAARVRLREGASVFVLARKPGGPPMPFAAEKHPAAALPLETTLDDSDSLMPTQKLSDQRDVELVARLSMRGDAEPQPGDLESAPVRVTLPAQGPVELVIGRER